MYIHIYEIDRNDENAFRGWRRFMSQGQQKLVLPSCHHVYVYVLYTVSRTNLSQPHLLIDCDFTFLEVTRLP